MKKDEIFFANDGLTSTSANHVANMAKEAYLQLSEYLDGITFCTEHISLLGSDSKTQISAGVPDVDHIEEFIDKITQLKALISWLREGIKARAGLLEELSRMSIREYCEQEGIEFPKTPNRDDYKPLTEDEYYGSLSIKERNAYYTLEAKVATLGKYVHVGGSISEARKRLQKILNNPTTVADSGRDMTVRTCTPSVEPEKVENLFFELQAKHRELQAALNAIKHKCDLAVESSAMEKHTAYNTACAAYRARIEELNGLITKYKADKTIEIEKLKIVIPDALKPIYHEVVSLGK